MQRGASRRNNVATFRMMAALPIGHNAACRLNNGNEGGDVDIFQAGLYHQINMAMC